MRPDRVTIELKDSKRSLIVADSNGFFHPLGDHAQATFSIDGQPISDQQSKVFSTQIPLNAISSMELNSHKSLGRFLILDGGYLWKYTDNAYDFDTLFNSPIHFPVFWRKSKIDGVSLWLGSTTVHGLQAETTMGHTCARFIGPEVGGLIFNSPLDTSVFSIDHDQALQQTTNVRYQRPKNGAWFSFTWRYDNGEVAGAVTSLADALRACATITIHI
jgi:hypothetical protein